MAPQTYFYSFKTSPYLDVCVIEVKSKTGTHLAFIRLRNSKGELLP